MDKITQGYEWIKARVSERTSWDGVVILAGSLFLLLGGVLADWALWAAAGWGAYTIWKEEKSK